jgi:two-component system sensor histidine kinase AlgZ
MSPRSEGAADELFLPDFCGIRAVFGVVVLAELLVFVITLVDSQARDSLLDELAVVSLFVQWVALSCAGLLCIARRGLARLGDISAAALSYAGILCVTWLLSEIAWWILNRAGAAADMSPEAHAHFLFRSLALAAIVGALALRYLYVQHHWRRRVESESAARIEALQSRIRPHFLFNCMNTIASLTRTRPEAAEQAVEDLADLFRASLGDARSRVPLTEELELCRQYLRIEGLRLGPRLAAVWDIDTLPPDALVPALSLQPLIENAIYHGIEPSTEGGPIRIGGRREGDRLIIRIENPLPPTPAPAHDGNRIAQANVRERLAAHYGKAGTLEVQNDGRTYRVIVALPYETGAHARAGG